MDSFWGEKHLTVALLQTTRCVAAEAEADPAVEPAIASDRSVRVAMPFAPFVAFLLRSQRCQEPLVASLLLVAMPGYPLSPCFLRENHVFRAPLPSSFTPSETSPASSGLPPALTHTHYRTSNEDGRTRREERRWADPLALWLVDIILEHGGIPPRLEFIPGPP